MPTEYVVRATSARDEPLISALLKASYPRLMRAFYDAALLAAVLPELTRANPTLVASGSYYAATHVDGSLIGCGGWTRERPGSGEVVSGLAHIRHFATHPDWSGRGVGRAIYDTCEEAARLANVERFECYASLNAEGFYGALGFRTVRRIAVPMGPGSRLPAVLMSLSI